MESRNEVLEFPVVKMPMRTELALQRQSLKRIRCARFQVQVGPACGKLRRAEPAVSFVREVAARVLRLASDDAEWLFAIRATRRLSRVRTLMTQRYSTKLPKVAGNVDKRGT